MFRVLAFITLVFAFLDVTRASIDDVRVKVASDALAPRARRENERPIDRSFVALSSFIDTDVERAYALNLCHCEFSSDATGLACAREGAVVGGFEASGEYAGRDAADEGLVPLSRAICCVPCFENVLNASQTIGETFVKVSASEGGDLPLSALRALSVDCVGTRANARGGPDVSCPLGTFLQGFKRVNKASSGNSAFYYPRDIGECCKVKFALPSGDALGTEACACATEPAADVSCGGVNTVEDVGENGAVITGFANAINAMGALGQPMRVPSTPLTCCKTCVSKSAVPQPMSDGCSHLNFCNAHGDCVIDGHCECRAGWTGDDCGSVDDGSGGMYGDAWQYSVMLSGIILGCCIRAMLCRHVEQVNMMRAQRFMMQEPLLRRAANSTVMDEWEEASDLSTSDDEDDDGGERGEHSEGDVEMANAATPRIERATSADASVDAEDEIQDNGTIPPSSSVEVSEDEEGEPVLTKKSKERSGVPDSECVVCMASPVQCVLIPCGHACMCRKCSRRMRRCPVCRVVVTRRQKLYMHASV